MQLIKIALIFISISITWCCTDLLRADLNGTLTPIILDSKYTFSDGETMSGLVYLNAGCDLPVNGTVTFNTVSGAVVEGSISGTNSTIRFTKNAFLGPNSKLFGSFFFHGENAAVVSMAGVKTIPMLTLTGQITLQGLGRCEIRHATNKGLLLDNAQLSLCTLRNMSIIGVTVRTSSSGLNTLRLDTVNISVGQTSPLVIRTPVVEIVGPCSFTSFRSTIDIRGRLNCVQSGELTITPLTKIKLPEVILLNTTCRLILANCQVDIADPSNPGSDIIIGASSLTPGTVGKIIIEGNTTISSTSNNKLLVPSGLDILFDSGSRLVVANDTYLGIY